MLVMALPKSHTSIITNKKLQLFHNLPYGVNWHLFDERFNSLLHPFTLILLTFHCALLKLEDLK
jgi:hypothetical protein